MTITEPHTHAYGGYPFSGIFVPFTFVSFSLALATDLLFWQTANLMWQDFSAWLLFAGEVAGGLALIGGIIDLLRPSTRYARPSLFAALLFIVILLVGLLNNFIHAGDGWTAVVPWGLALSAINFVLIIATFGLSASHRSRLYVRVA